MTDGYGTPLSLVHTGANRPDHQSMEPLLGTFAGVSLRGRGRPRRKFEAVYADSAYAMSHCYQAIRSRGMEARLARRSESSERIGHIWYAVERTFSWHDGYRKLRIGDE